LTADHGNVEEMRFPDGGMSTQHSTNPVPVAFVSRDPGQWTIRDGGLADIAPTLLELLGISVPDRMTGRSLLERR
ncbi:MAG TPA: 2,3-bisphosphoglycerate-independent phosphoglycerate mutase, partial [Candidatus Limnocylindria bacterium]|nr:2,3-bisphosphoglycerate-independent phosphoglycerate mutase [Candidatus Limnocylindria bacterium]